jgi:hypothetical protein
VERSIQQKSWVFFIYPFASYSSGSSQLHSSRVIDIGQRSPQAINGGLNLLRVFAFFKRLLVILQTRGFQKTNNSLSCAFMRL